MSKVLIQMSMSLDGYVAGPNDSDINGLGDGGLVLHQWMFAGSGPGEGLAGADQEVFDDLRGGIGAMISGRVANRHCPGPARRRHPVVRRAS